jgi:hypothetical protein
VRVTVSTASLLPGGGMLSQNAARWLLTSLIAVCFAAQGKAQKPEWQVHLDWCSGNRDAGGSVDCPADYLGTYPECYASGGRACLIGKARQSARDHDCANAF